MYILLSLLLALSDITSFKVESRPKVHVDRYDFPGSYPGLEEITIDATRKMRVELSLPGDYPLLKTIAYEGSFGTLSGTLTGHFPQLQHITFLASSAALKLDLRAPWDHSCTIDIKDGRGDIDLILPKDVALTIHTKVGIKGKVINNSFEKQGRGLLTKTYINPTQLNNPIHLTLNIETSEGKIILN